MTISNLVIHTTEVQLISSIFPPLPLANWRATRDTIRGYTLLTARIRRASTPPRKNWWHASLHVAASGLTTTPIRSADKTYELLLDFTHHRLLITTSHGERRDFPLNGQSLSAFKNQTLAVLAELDIQDPQIGQDLFAGDSPGTYDETAVSNYWQALSQIDAVLKEFRSSFRGESSPVQFWSHHFDIAVNWYSGRLVPGQDPDNAEWADEQMNFGFSTGDEGTPDPYFYATAYPLPSPWLDTLLPEGAYWQSEGWTGAVLPYELLATGNGGRELLLHFLNSLQSAGAELMK